MESRGPAGPPKKYLECDIYITGSNAKRLSGEQATYLAVRYVEFVICPFLSWFFYALSGNIPGGNGTESIFQQSDTRRNAVSTETILNYIKACEEDAFLLYHVRRQNLQGKKYLQ